MLNFSRFPKFAALTLGALLVVVSGQPASAQSQRSNLSAEFDGEWVGKFSLSAATSSECRIDWKVEKLVVDDRTFEMRLRIAGRRERLAGQMDRANTYSGIHNMTVFDLVLANSPRDAVVTINMQFGDRVIHGNFSGTFPGANGNNFQVAEICDGNFAFARKGTRLARTIMSETVTPTFVARALDPGSELPQETDDRATLDQELANSRRQLAAKEKQLLALREERARLAKQDRRAQAQPISSFPARPVAKAEAVRPQTSLPATGPRNRSGERRTALIVGNSNYANSPLRNPVSDARLMSRSLRAIGFDVIERVDASRREMRLAILEFGDKLEKGGVGLFYYAGHGVQVGGQNFLIPVGARVNREAHVSVEGVSVNQVLARMEGARNRLNIVVLDACRNNPYSRSFRSAPAGLAQMLAPTGTYIAYATAPGQVAMDGRGINSPFTSAVAQAIAVPDVKLEDVFKNVRVEVKDVSGGRQVPWTSSSIVGDFYFSKSAEGKSVLAPKTTGSNGVNPAEIAFWQSIKDRKDKASFQAYLKSFPQGVFAELARIRIQDLGAR